MQRGPFRKHSSRVVPEQLDNKEGVYKETERGGEVACHRYGITIRNRDRTSAGRVHRRAMPRAELAIDLSPPPFDVFIQR